MAHTAVSRAPQTHSLCPGLPRCTPQCPDAFRGRLGLRHHDRLCRRPPRQRDRSGLAKSASGRARESVAAGATKSCRFSAMSTRAHTHAHTLLVYASMSSVQGAGDGGALQPRGPHRRPAICESEPLVAGGSYYALFHQTGIGADRSTVCRPLIHRGSPVLRTVSSPLERNPSAMVTIAGASSLHGGGGTAVGPAARRLGS